MTAFVLHSFVSSHPLAAAIFFPMFGQACYWLGWILRGWHDSQQDHGR